MRAPQVPLHVDAWMRILALLAILILAGSGLTACASDETQAAEKVTAQGFTVSLDNGAVTATAPKGVAGIDSEVTLKRKQTALPTSYSKYLKSVGTPVVLTIGNGQQPNKPITVRFRIDPKDVPTDAGGMGVLTKKAGATEPSIIPGTYDRGTGLLTVVTDHLSPLDPFFFQVDQYFRGLETTLNTAFGITYPKPRCANSATLGNSKFSASGNTGGTDFVPCLSAKDGKVLLKIVSTSSMPRYLVASPATQGVESGQIALDSVGALALAHEFAKNPKQTELMPGGDVTYTFDENAPIQAVALRSDSKTVYSLIFMTMLTSLVDGIPLANVSDALSCIQDYSDSASTDRTDAERAGAYVKVFINCGGKVLAYVYPVAAIVWGLIAAAPAAIWNSFIDQSYSKFHPEQIPILTINRKSTNPNATLGDYLTYKMDPQGYRSYNFASPSGNLQCEIAQYEDSAPWGCVAVQHSWSDPTDLPYVYNETCPRLLGAMFAQYPGGGFYNTCTNENALFKSRAKVLPLGSSISFNNVTCTSTTVSGAEGMVCTGPKGTALTMSKSAMTFKQPTSGWIP